MKRKEDKMRKGLAERNIKKKKDKMEEKKEILKKNKMDENNKWGWEERKKNERTCRKKN